MAVSSMIGAIQSIFATPEYNDRLPTTVKQAIANGTFGTTDFPADITNEVFQTLVNKIARQDIYAFNYNNVDVNRFFKGYLGAGAITEDDYIEAIVADETTELNATTMGTGFDFTKWNPYKPKLPTVRSAYYDLKTLLQYRVTTSYDMFKRAFINENAATDFVTMIRSVLPASMALDKYLLFKKMIADNTANSIYGANATVTVTAAGDHFTVDESVRAITAIRQIVNAVKWNTTKYNKAGVLTSSSESNLVLFISQGIHTELTNSQYSAFKPVLDMGVEVVPIDGFGAEALTTGQFACLLDKRAIKLYDWQGTRSDAIFNPVNAGYWNTFLTNGNMWGYNLFATAVRFVLTNGQA